MSDEIDDLLAEFDFPAIACRRLWDAYELATRRTARLREDDPHDELEAAVFHETLLEHLVFANEGGVVEPLHPDGAGVVVHVNLWEDD